MRSKKTSTNQQIRRSSRLANKKTEQIHDDLPEEEEEEEVEEEVKISPKKRAKSYADTNRRAKKPRVTRARKQKSEKSEKSVEQQSNNASDRSETVGKQSEPQDTQETKSEFLVANSEGAIVDSEIDNKSSVESIDNKSKNKPDGVVDGVNEINPIPIDNNNSNSDNNNNNNNNDGDNNNNNNNNILALVDDDTDPIVQQKWVAFKARLFEIPKQPKPPYKEYQDKMLIKRPWMKKKDIDYLHKILSNPKSELGYKVMKHIINFNVYKNFTDEQKSRLLKLLPRSELVPIASEAGEPIDTPRIERERQAQGLKLYEAGITETITDIDPTKVVPRFDFWLSDAFKDARWWFQLSIRYGYYTKIGVDTQWNNLEKFKAEVPNYWKNDAFEQDWGIGLWGKMGNKQVAGDSAQISLPDMVKARIIRPNDDLKYKRQFKGLGVTVSMDLKITTVNESNGHLQIMLIKGDQNKIISDVNNPTRLEHELLDWDGQVPRQSRPNGNAFKNFSIQRSAEYTPSLFEARKEYWVKNS